MAHGHAKQITVVTTVFGVGRISLTEREGPVGHSSDVGEALGLQKFC